MASLALKYQNKITPIDPTIPGGAATFAGYVNELVNMGLIAYNDSGTEVNPIVDDIQWSITNSTVATLGATVGLTNSVTFGPNIGETTITVVWKSKNVKGTFRVITVSHTTMTTVSYDDGVVLGQLIKIVTEPTAPGSNDPAGRTKIYIANDTIPNLNEINSKTGQSTIDSRGSIIKMTDAMTITGDGLLPIKINSNVGDPINVKKTLTFYNKTLNVPIQVTLLAADYFDIYTEFGSLKNFNFIVQPQEVQTVEYGINKDTIKLLSPDVYNNPIRIKMFSLDSGQILLS